MRDRKDCMFFFFNDPATPEISTLPLPDALPICPPAHWPCRQSPPRSGWPDSRTARSEEHTSELQSHLNLVCRLLLEKKKLFNAKNDGVLIFIGHADNDAKHFQLRALYKMLTCHV